MGPTRLPVWYANPCDFRGAARSGPGERKRCRSNALFRSLSSVQGPVMYNDVIDLREFYAASTGQVAQRLVQRHIRETWPDLHGMNLLGVGYATPFLSPFMTEAQRVIAMMPARQGVVRWPAHDRNIAFLGSEEDMPLADLSMDRVLLVHALECSEQVRKLLREVWRVMADGARLMIVVPNRRGIWARFDHTPFGHGHPYTLRQVSRLLRDNMLVPAGSAAGLFVPPTRSRMLLKSAPAIEEIGVRWFQTFSGVLLIEAEKEIYGGAPAVQAPVARKRTYVRVVGGSDQSACGQERLLSRERRKMASSPRRLALVPTVPRRVASPDLDKESASSTIRFSSSQSSAKSRIVQGRMFGVSYQL